MEIAGLLVILMMALPALAWWGLVRGRLDRIDRQDDVPLRQATFTGSDTAHLWQQSGRIDPDPDEHVTGRRSNGSVHGMPAVNPANGLPMMNEAFDIHGNPYGFDLHSQSVNPANGFDDHASHAFHDISHHHDMSHDSSMHGGFDSMGGTGLGCGGFE